MGDFLLNGRCNGMSRTKESRRIDRLVENRPKRPPEARKSDKNTANTQQVRFFKLYFDFNVCSAENRRLFSIEFQLHTNSHITLGYLLTSDTYPPVSLSMPEKKLIAMHLSVLFKLPLKMNLMS